MVISLFVRLLPIARECKPIFSWHIISIENNILFRLRKNIQIELLLIFVIKNVYRCLAAFSGLGRLKLRRAQHGAAGPIADSIARIALKAARAAA
ncbi:hypothetical protein J2Z17_001964 [Rhizobium halophytocola]|uniref:Uncharacterized protein n=1 Tax=Rhizobium halophytocola TaxID=735519 RepID=A0ABS4DXW1_9HYPH|nr:hypothetical protein [Rhizobium halophytocola]